MRPMSLFESGHADGQVSLAALLDGATPRAPDPGLSVMDLADLVTVGGWPAQQGQRVLDAARGARDYLEQIRSVDVSRVGETRRDPFRVGAVMTSLARNVATEVKNSVLAADAGGSDGPLSEHTVAAYLGALTRLMVIEDQPAWAPHLRAKAVLRKSPKRHFVCPSLAVAALAAGPERLLADLNLFGLLFESLVVRDLRVLSQPLDGRVLHYRDNYGVEVDAIVQLADGRWGAFEVKLGSGEVDAAAASLLRFRRQIDTTRCGEPAVLGVICGTGFTYRRDDGVAVIAVGSLGP
jgi:predicted AAA+ superfamily ATPase